MAIGAIGAAATVILGWIAYQLSKQAQRYTAQRSIGDLQSAVANFRAEYPEVMAVSPEWGDTQAAILHGQSNGTDRDSIVRYYSYVELGLEFCNTALAARSRGSIPDDVFSRHYRPLIRHFLAENKPFIEYALRGPYLSDYVREEWTAAEASGWNWHERFHRLAGSD